VARARTVANLTDRALRYRAVASSLLGPKRCGYCGSRRNVGVDHIDGREENGAGRNLMYACKSCNTAKGFAFRRAGLGRRTVQFNPADGRPARTINQWMLAGLSVCGRSDAMGVREAAEMIAATSPARRAEFAAEMANPAAPRTAPSFAQYAWAVSQGGPGGHHYETGGAHDEAGAVIHATPKHLRRQYAKDIAAGKASRSRAGDLSRWD
jgi:hypothetical protein